MTRSSLAILAILCLASFGLVSCKSSPKKGVPKNLPNIKVSSSAAPPKHNMNRGEYPFDEKGNYVAAWAAEGARGGGNVPAPQMESPVELVTPEPEPPKKNFGSRSSRMVLSTASATPPPQPVTAPPARPDPAPTPTVRTSRPPPRPTPTVASASSSSARKPTSSSSSTSKPKPKTPSKPASSSLSYTVKSGDTLYALALRYKSTVAKIKSASGISSDKLKIGQKLKIPR
jgi:LysM domain